MDSVPRTARGNRRRRSGSPLYGQLLTATVESAADVIAIRFNPIGEPGDQREITPLAVLELVAAGMAGASIVLPDNAIDLDTALAEEWVTHLLAEPAWLADLDPGALPDPRAVVADAGTVPEQWRSIPLVALPGLAR
ncbi:hypothetical protein [Nocardia sp. NBC_01388]|uniref:hypothetical protein n=1 Tax=Nocardia sp. NBC_01388 TaxID=2903596 RepID=UPI00324CB13C